MNVNCLDNVACPKKVHCTCTHVSPVSVQFCLLSFQNYNDAALPAFRKLRIPFRVPLVASFIPNFQTETNLSNFPFFLFAYFALVPFQECEVSTEGISDTFGTCCQCPRHRCYHSLFVLQDTLGAIKLPGAPGLTTRSKDATRNKGHRY